jgi:hypothetical protein
MKKIVGQAREVEENRMGDPSPEVKAALIRMEATIISKVADTRGEIDDKLKSEYLKKGQNTAYAMNRLAALQQKANTLYPDGKDVEGTPPTTQDKIMEVTLRKNRDPDATYEYLDAHPEVIPRLVMHPDGQRMLDRMLGNAERAEGSKWDGVNKGVNVIDAAVAEVEISTDEGAKIEAQLNQWVDSNPDMKVSDIQAKATEMVEKQKQSIADATKVGEIIERGPANSQEADLILQEFAPEEAAALAEVESTLSFEKSYEDVKFGFLGGAGPMGRLRTPAPGQLEDYRIYQGAKQRRLAAEEAHDLLVQRRQAIERKKKRLLKSEAKVRGMNEEGADQTRIWTGDYASEELIDR